MPSKKNGSNKNASEDKQKRSQKRKHEDDDFHDASSECEDQDNDFFEASSEFILDDLTEERVDINDSDKQLQSRTRKKTSTTTANSSSAQEEMVADIDLRVASIPPKKRMKYLASSNSTPISFFSNPSPIKTTTQTTVTESHAHPTKNNFDT